MKVLTFKVWAPYAHFRRPYTTRSPATFSIPPRPTILGMLGAIMGLDKERYPEHLKYVKIGVRVNGEIRKIRTTINLMDTKDNKLVQRTQMLHEFISDPKYTIAVTAEEKILEGLYERLANRRFHYTPYLGTAQHIARIYEPTINEFSEVSEVETTYVAPVEAVVGVDNQKKYIVERQAYHIDAERKATGYIDVAIPVGKTIKVRATDTVTVTSGGHVLW